MYPSIAIISAIAASVVAKTVVIEAGQSGLTFVPDSTTADVGDVLEFHFYGSFHSAVQGDFSTPCQMGSMVSSGFNSGPIRNQPDGSGNVFQVTVKNTNPIWFYCGTPSHCQSGMSGVVNPPSSGNTLARYRTSAGGTTSSQSLNIVQGGVVVPAKSEDSDSSSSQGSTSPTQSTSSSPATTASTSSSSSSSTPATSSSSSASVSSSAGSSSESSSASESTSTSEASSTPESSSASSSSSSSESPSTTESPSATIIVTSQGPGTTSQTSAAASSAVTSKPSSTTTPAVVTTSGGVTLSGTAEKVVIMAVMIGIGFLVMLMA